MQLFALRDAIATHQEAYTLSEMIHYAYFQTMCASELCADFAQQGDWKAARQWVALAHQYRHPAALDFPGFDHQAEITTLVQQGEVDLAQTEAARIAALVGENPRYQQVYQACCTALDGETGATFALVR